MYMGLHPAFSPPPQSVIQIQWGTFLVTSVKNKTKQKRNVIRLQPGSTSHIDTAGNLAF